MTATDLRILTIQNLRGSVSSFDLAFRSDAKLTVIYGENGSGKSTICDAIEFLGDGRVGSLEDRGLGNRTSRYWPSIGKVASDIKVSLEAGSQTCVATIRDGVVVVQPGEWRPRVAILRRPQILRLLDAQPAKRYEEISHFVDLEPIERAESALKQLIDDVETQRATAVAVIVENEEQIERFWLAAGSPGEDALAWADAECDRPVADTEATMVALGDVERSYGALTAYPSRYEAIRTQVEAASQGLVIAEARQAAAIRDQAGNDADTLPILEAAHTFLSDPGHDLTACPLCRSRERASGLLDAVQARIESMSQIREATQAVAMAALRVRDANNARRMLDADYQRDRVLLQDALKQYRQADPTAPSLTALPDDLSSLPDWLAESTPTVEAWTAARDRMRDESQFASTLRATLNNYRTNVEEQGLLDQLLPRLRSAHGVVRTERQTFTDGVLASIARRVNELYAQVHPGEGAGGLTMELTPSRRASLELGSSFGGQTGLPPQAYYSQSHLDTLGICVFLALMEMDQPEQTILVLDDVLASLDEPHVERLARMIASIATGFRHCLVTTHYRPWREKLRWGLLQDGSTELLELKRWSLAGGMQLTRTVPEVDRLRDDLTANEVDLQGCVSRAGVILEAILDHITLTYECALPRKRTTTPYTVGELLDGISTRLRSALKIDVRTVDADGNASYSSKPLGPLIASIQEVAQTRNAMGAHFTDLSFELLDDDAVRFATLVLELADAVIDSDAGWPMNASSGSYWATRGDTRRMHPLRRPS